MPRQSKKTKVINLLSARLKARLNLRAVRIMDDEEDSVEDLKDLATAVSLSTIRKRRYISRSTKYRKSPAETRFKTDLNDVSSSSDSSGTSSELPWLSDEEFLQKYRVTRKSFDIILEKIRNHPVFESKTKRIQTIIDRVELISK
jgi:hypothetical protein